MQDEVGQGIGLGIKLLMVAAIVTIGFLAFTIGKGLMGDGIVKVQDSLLAVSDSDFDDFDQKIVTGSQLTGAYKTFQGKPVAILVNTQALTKGVPSHPAHSDVYSLQLNDSANTNYINYNAILATDSDGTKVNPKTGGDPITSGQNKVVEFKDGTVILGTGFALDNTTGKIIFDNNTIGISKAGNCEYISSASKFDTNIIVDNSGVKVGILFTQLAN